MKNGRLIATFCFAFVTFCIWWSGNKRKMEPSGTLAEQQSPPTIAETLLQVPLDKVTIRHSNNIAGRPTREEFFQLTRRDPRYEWKRPIEFFGKVVDEQNKPVDGASIRFVWSDLSSKGTSEAHTFSDVDGLFCLKGVRGKGLSVHISSADHYVSQSRNQFAFEYADPDEPIFHIPDPNNPVIFHLRRKGQTERLVVMRSNLNIPGVGRQFRLLTNGTPTRVDFVSGKIVEYGGSLEVRCWIRNETGEFNKAYDWSYELTVPEGGLILSTNEFDFEAPLENYLPSIRKEIHKNSEQPWTGRREEKYFLKLANGNYARMRFVIYAGESPFCIIEAFVNPSGSRNLEFSPDKIVGQERTVYE